MRVLHKSIIRSGHLIIATLAALFIMSVTPASANSKYAALVVHADTGDVLFSKYATGKRYPASLTKMMTLYLLFEEIDAGRVSLGTKLKVTKKAAYQPPSKLGLRLRDEITVDEAIRALVVKSANDVAVVVAEHIATSEVRFARKMTKKAHELGMRSTTFKNASGLPNKRQVSTARDLATLSQRLIQDFPQHFHYFQLKSFTFKGKTHKSHNKVVINYTGADGLKTGYTRLSGYNLSTTAKRGNHRLIGIVLGGKTSRSRNAHMEKILTNAFTRIRKNPSLLKASLSNRPVPRLKNETLNAVGGQWPPKNTSQGDTLTLMQTDEPATEIQYSLTASLEPASPANADDLNFKSLEQAILSNPLREEATEIGEGDFTPINPATPWSIQIGAYHKLEVAEKHAAAARNKIIDFAPYLIEDVTAITSKKKTVYRIRFLNLTETEADKACAEIIASGGDCFSLRDRSISG